MRVILIVCRIRLSQGNQGNGNKIQKSLSCMHIAFIYLEHATSLLLLQNCPTFLNNNRITDRYMVQEVRIKHVAR